VPTASPAGAIVVQEFAFFAILLLGLSVQPLWQPSLKEPHYLGLEIHFASELWTLCSQRINRPMSFGRGCNWSSLWSFLAPDPSETKNVLSAGVFVSPDCVISWQVLSLSAPDVHNCERLCSARSSYRRNSWGYRLDHRKTPRWQTVTAKDALDARKSGRADQTALWFETVCVPRGGCRRPRIHYCFRAFSNRGPSAVLDFASLLP